MQRRTQTPNQWVPTVDIPSICEPIWTGAIRIETKAIEHRYTSLTICKQLKLHIHTIVN